MVCNICMFSFFRFLYKICFDMWVHIHVWPSEERGGSVVEYLTRDRGVAGSNLTGALTCVLEPDTLTSA